MRVLEEISMTPMEIHNKIKYNNERIQELFNPSQFVLNNMVKDLLKENESLQKQCPHCFVDGYCEYCFMEEPKK